MKHAAFVLAIVVAAFVIGCQDNSITDPVASDVNSPADVLSKAKPNGDTQLIPLSGVLVEPGGFNTYVGIEGFIEASTSLGNDGVLRQFKVETSAFAELYPFDFNAFAEPYPFDFNANDDAKCGWTISGKAADVVTVKSTSPLEKIYAVAGRDDRLIVHIRLQLARDGKVQLDGMWLTKGKRIERAVDQY